MERIDFTNWKASKVQYGGADEKIGVLFCNGRYILKFKKKTLCGEAYNDISEYIGCKVFKELGFNVQETFLGIYNKRKVVACKDFCVNGVKLKPFADVGESSVEDGKYFYTFENVKKLIYESKKFPDNERENVIKHFWDTYIVDCLLANSDRHSKNWGYLKVDDYYKIAPIFDNGNCLFSGLVDEEEIKDIQCSEDELMERVKVYPKSMISIDKKEGSSYYDVITSKSFADCNEAIKRIFPKIELNKINRIIDSINEKDLSKNRKQFLKTIIKLRYEMILKKTYEDLICQKQ